MEQQSWHSWAAVFMSAMTFYSSPFPVAKLSLYSACSSGGGGLAFDRWEEYVFLWHLPSPSHLNQWFCNLHDLWIEFSACLERRLLKRRTTVALSDLASRTDARPYLDNLLVYGICCIPAIELSMHCYFLWLHDSVEADRCDAIAIATCSHCKTFCKHFFVFSCCVRMFSKKTMLGWGLEKLLVSPLGVFSRPNVCISFLENLDHHQWSIGKYKCKTFS